MKRKEKFVYTGSFRGLMMDLEARKVPLGFSYKYHFG